MPFWLSRQTGHGLQCMCRCGTGGQPMSNVRFNDDSILARYFGRSSNYTDIPNELYTKYNVKKDIIPVLEKAGVITHIG